MYSKILVRFGELTTKGKNRGTFVKQLATNITRLTGAKPEVNFDRIFLNYTPDVVTSLGRIFGIQSYSPVAVAASNEESIVAKTLELIAQSTAQTFKVSVKRHWKGYPGTSTALNGLFGSRILQHRSFAVDVHNPELHVEIEIREQATYIFVERIKGLGGYPVGINGRVLHLISGGIDSPVAAWKMMKRGVHVDFLNFITPPHTDRLTIDKVDRIITLLCAYQGSAVLYRNHYTDLMNYLGMISDQAYKITMMRRSFYRLASRLAHEHRYLGIANGENLGQVASQTLESMDVIGSQATMQIYRPLLTADKIETIGEAINLGTYPISIEPASEACELFAPVNPVTKPSRIKVEQLEAEMTALNKMEDDNFTNGFTKSIFRYQLIDSKE